MRKTLFLALALTVVPSAFAAEVFSNFPSTLPPNLPSLGYQATQTAEFGNKIGFAGTERSLTSVEVGLSSWAKHSDWTGVGDSTGFDHNMTFNIYNVGSGDSVGSLLATVTQSVHVLWRPEADNPDGSYTGPDNQHYNGKLFTTSFDFSSLNVTLPEEVIFGLAFNTQTWGANPIGAPGPYNSLNFAVAGAPTVGTDLDPDDVYWNTMTAGNYSDGGVGGVGTFRRDTNWAPYVPMVKFNAAPVPEPATMSVLGLGALALLRRRRAK